MSERMEDIIQKMKENKEVQKRKTEIILEDIRKKEEERKWYKKKRKANRENYKCN